MWVAIEADRLRKNKKKKKLFTTNNFGGIYNIYYQFNRRRVEIPQVFERKLCLER